MSHVNIRYRMSDVRCHTSFQVGREPEGAVPAVLKERDPHWQSAFLKVSLMALPTTKANGLCLSYSKVFRAVVAVHRHCLLTSQLCRPPLGLSESLTVPILEQQDSFSLLPKGLEQEMLHVQSESSGFLPTYYVVRQTYDIV